MPKIKITQSAVKDFLQPPLARLLWDYTNTHYEIPQMSDREWDNMDSFQYEDFAPNFQKVIFSTPKLSKRFLDWVMQYHTPDKDFDETCQYINDNAQLFYVTSPRSEKEKKHNKSMDKIFLPWIDQWASDMVLSLEKKLTKTRKQEKDRELETLAKLAKKHQKTLK